MRGFGIFVVYFFIELGLFILFAQHFGFLSLVGEILLSGAIGVFLFMNAFGNSDVMSFFRSLKTPQEFLASNLTTALGAILLILPGLLSDGVGILLYFGLFDGFLVRFFERFFPSFFPSKRMNEEEEIIDVEVIEEGRANEEDYYRK